MWNESQNLFSKVLHLIWESRQFLYVKVHYSRIFHSYWYHFKQQISDSLILESKVSQQETSSHSKGVVMTRYSCSMSLGEILFPVNSAAGFICVWWRSRQIYIFPVWDHFYIFTSITTWNTNHPEFWLVMIRAVFMLGYKYKGCVSPPRSGSISCMVDAQKYFLDWIWLLRNNNISCSSKIAHQASKTKIRPRQVAA